MTDDVEISAYMINVCNKYCSLGDTGNKSCSRSELKVSTCISMDMMEEEEDRINKGEL